MVNTEKRNDKIQNPLRCATVSVNAMHRFMWVDPILSYLQYRLRGIVSS